MRRLVIAAAVALVAAACGGSPTPDAASLSPAATAGEQPTAPDFTLALGEGGTFTLADETRPVYMIFWAEW